MADLVIPTVHLNGTSQEALLHQTLVAIHALDKAHAKLCQAGPHGRDYYPQGDDAIQAALAQHRARLRALEVVKTELDQIATAILAQGD